MEDDKNAAAEAALEQNALAEIKEDEVREKVISEYSFDPEADKERIDKLVTREVENRKALTTAIGQKIKYRSEVEKLKTAPKTETKEVSVDLSKMLTEEFERRDLEAMEYPDDIKARIQKLAKLDNISIKKAEADPIIQPLIEKWKKENGAEEAAISRKNNSPSRTVHDIDNPPDVDMTTEKGRKEYDAWKEKMIKAGY